MMTTKNQKARTRRNIIICHHDDEKKKKTTKHQGGRHYHHHYNNDETPELLGVVQHLGGSSHTRKADLLLMMHNYSPGHGCRFCHGYVLFAKKYSSRSSNRRHEYHSIPNIAASRGIGGTRRK